MPDVVGSLEFDDVTDSSLRVTWSPPVNVNGVLRGYTLTYMRKDEDKTKIEREFQPEVLTYVISGLRSTTVYTVEVFARTSIGKGAARSADVESGVPPELPGAPTNLGITNIRPASVILQFQPGFNGYTSISKWIVEGQLSLINSVTSRKRRQADGGEAEWEVVYEVTDPEATSLNVTNLRPYTRYVLRLTAENVLGRSTASEPTAPFETMQASPAQPPDDVTIRAVNETALRVTWTVSKSVLLAASPPPSPSAPTKLKVV